MCFALANVSQSTADHDWSAPMIFILTIEPMEIQCSCRMTFLITWEQHIICRYYKNVIYLITQRRGNCVDHFDHATDFVLGDCYEFNHQFIIYISFCVTLAWLLHNLCQLRSTVIAWQRLKDSYLVLSPAVMPQFRTKRFSITQPPNPQHKFRDA